MPEVVTIQTPALGDRSYLIHDDSLAVVVDPQRDIGRVLSAAESCGARITHVLETHIHNDYVTGGFALASQVGAEYVDLQATNPGLPGTVKELLGARYSAFEKVIISMVIRIKAANRLALAA